MKHKIACAFGMSVAGLLVATLVCPIIWATDPDISVLHCLYLAAWMIFSAFLAGLIMDDDTNPLGAWFITSVLFPMLVFALGFIVVLGLQKAGVL